MTVGPDHRSGLPVDEQHGRLILVMVGSCDDRTNQRQSNVRHFLGSGSQIHFEVRHRGCAPMQWQEDAALKSKCPAGSGALPDLRPLPACRTWPGPSWLTFMRLPSTALAHRSSHAVMPQLEGVIRNR